MEEAQKIMAQKANAGRALVLSESASRRVKAGDLENGYRRTSRGRLARSESPETYFLLASTLRRSSADPVEVKNAQASPGIESQARPAHHQLGMAPREPGRGLKRWRNFESPSSCRPVLLKPARRWAKPRWRSKIGKRRRRSFAASSPGSLEIRRGASSIEPRR